MNKRIVAALLLGAVVGVGASWGQTKDNAGAAPTVLTLPGKPRKSTRAARAEGPVRARKAVS